MVAEMNRIENAARLTMADLSSELPVTSIHFGISSAAKLSFVLALLSVAGLIGASLF